MCGGVAGGADGSMPRALAVNLSEYMLSATLVVPTSFRTWCTVSKTCSLVVWSRVLMFSGSLTEMSVPLFSIGS